jgi:hypothetical protein
MKEERVSSRRELDVCLLSQDAEIIEEFGAPPDGDEVRGLARRVLHGLSAPAVIESMTGARFGHVSCRSSAEMC